jgi:serine/threonine-protein kinase RIO1
MRERAFYNAASRLLRNIHAAGVVHNDLAKEPNLLVLDDGSPAFIDYQLAQVFQRRTRLFRLAAREDIRHLLKHKRSYCAEALTRREQGILATPSLPSRLYMATLKPAYLFLTRRILGWADREGAHDRGAQR